MEYNALFALISLLSTSITALLWYASSQRLRQARFHVLQQTQRLQVMREDREEMDRQMAMKDARIANLEHTLRTLRRLQGQGSGRPNAAHDNAAHKNNSGLAA